MHPTVGLTSEEARRRLALHGRNIVGPSIVSPPLSCLLNTLKLLVVGHNTTPVALLLWAAIVVEIVLGNYITGSILVVVQIVMFVFSLHQAAAQSSEHHQRQRDFINSIRPTATVRRDDEWCSVDTTTLVPGDVVKLASGCQVPADCVLVSEGCQLDVDEALLTGESLPVTLTKEDVAKMGSVIVRGETDAVVERTGSATMYASSFPSSSRSPRSDGCKCFFSIKRMSQRTIWTFSLMAVIMVATSIAFLRFTTTNHEVMSFSTVLDFSAVLVVACIPLVLEVVIAAILAGGSRALAGNCRAIVKDFHSVEKMAGVGVLCADMTGTLTTNKMSLLQDETQVFLGQLPLVDGDEANNFQALVHLAVLCSKWWEPPRDALDTMLFEAEAQANRRCDDKVDMSSTYVSKEYRPFDPRTKRTEATIEERDTGRVFKVTKGAPHIILDLVRKTNNNNQVVTEKVERFVEDCATKAIRCLAVARTKFSNNNIDDAEDWEIAGVLTFHDPPRPDTTKAIQRAKDYGITVKSSTSNALVVGRRVNCAIGLGPNLLNTFDVAFPKFPNSGSLENINSGQLSEAFGPALMAADGFAKVYPEHKCLIAATLEGMGECTAITGDGVSDAVVFKCASVGIAVCGATDAAREASEVVMTEPGLALIVEALITARHTVQQVWVYLAYRIAATFHLGMTLFVAMFAFPIGKDVFRLPIVMLLLPALLNDGALALLSSTGWGDSVSAAGVASRTTKHTLQQRWRSKLSLSVVAIGMGSVNVVSTLILLWMCLQTDTNNEKYKMHSVFHTLGLPRLQAGQIVSAIFLKVTISDLLTYLACRTHSEWALGAAPPGKKLLGGMMVSISITTIVAAFWPHSDPDKIETIGLSRGNKGNVNHHMLPLYVWLWCIFWWFVQDATKVFSFKLAESFHPQVNTPTVNSSNVITETIPFLGSMESAVN